MLSHLDARRGAPTSLFLNPPLHPNWHLPRSVRPTTAICVRTRRTGKPSRRLCNCPCRTSLGSIHVSVLLRLCNSLKGGGERREVRGCVAPTLHTVTLPRLNRDGKRKRDRQTERENLDTYRRRVRTTSTPSSFPDVTPITFVSITLQMRRCLKIFISVET